MHSLKDFKFLRAETVMLAFMPLSVFMLISFYIYVLCYLLKYVFLSIYDQDGPGLPTYHTLLTVWCQEQLHKEAIWRRGIRGLWGKSDTAQALKALAGEVTPL